MGIVLAARVVAYVIPRTAGSAPGITAYLGGAVTANMRVEARGTPRTACG